MKATRHDRILSELARQGTVSVESLAGLVKVSEATVRRDLGELHQKGLLRRTHGGATLADNQNELPYQYKVTTFLAEKRRIGAVAASMIQPHQVIGCSGGTTVTQVIKALNGKPLTVVTNAINIAADLASSSEAEVIVTGGTLRQRSYEMVGHVAERTIREFMLDVALIGVDGLSPEHGLMTFSPVEAHVNRIFIQCAREVWVVTDHSKLGRTRPAVIAPIEQMTTLITDSDAPESLLDTLAKKGIRIVRA